eukprot:8298210-Pyramimonas_sp.AAC.1
MSPSHSSSSNAVIARTRSAHLKTSSSSTFGNSLALLASTSGSLRMRIAVVFDEARMLAVPAQRKRLLHKGRCDGPPLSRLMLDMRASRGRGSLLLCEPHPLSSSVAACLLRLEDGAMLQDHLLK